MEVLLKLARHEDVFITGRKKNSSNKVVCTVKDKATVFLFWFAVIRKSPKVKKKKEYLIFLYLRPFFFHTMLQEKYIGLILAMSSSVFIGLSFVITKKGLVSSRRRHGKNNIYILFSKTKIK